MHIRVTLHINVSKKNFKIIYSPKSLFYILTYKKFISISIGHAIISFPMLCKKALTKRINMKIKTFLKT